MPNKKKSNLSPLALLRIVAEDYIDYYALGGAKRGAVATAHKLPAEEIAEIVGDNNQRIDDPAPNLTLAPVVNIASHPAFDCSYLNERATLQRPEQAEPERPRPRLGEDRAILA